MFLIDSGEKLNFIEANNHVDIYLFGHQWLDESGEPLFDLNFDLISHGRKVFFLNKEYSSLGKKLAYIALLNPDVILTHHHDLQALAPQRIESSIEWVPFAANPELFTPGSGSRHTALNFSGILRNPSFPETQSDDREIVQNLLFNTYKNLIVGRKKPFRPFQVYWSAVTGNWPVDMWNRIYLRNTVQSGQNYAQRLANSRMTLNTLSPLGLVGTRYFETAMSKSLILTPKTSNLQGLFGEEHVVRFELSESSLISAFEFAVSDSNEKNSIVESAFSHAQKHHTWHVRTEQVMQRLGYELN